MDKKQEHIEACKRIIARGTCLSNTVYCSNCNDKEKEEARARGEIQCPGPHHEGWKCILGLEVESAKKYLEEQGEKI